MDKYIVSICITSYNRVNELERVLRSIDSLKYVDQIEIIISEDKSPRKEEIRQAVNFYKQNSKFRVLFNTNENNLGYDRNLGKLKSLANGKFILFISDDDVFHPKILDNYLDFLGEKNCALCFQPFINNGKLSRKYNGSIFFGPSEKNVGEHIYDSILFSGLTFKREFVKNIDPEPFLNSNYFQVYMFMTLAYKYGINYYDNKLVDCIMDGENAYGLSESSLKNEDLANRNSVFSNLEFNKGLSWVINRFDKENSTNCMKYFAKEYSLRTLPGMIKAKKNGKIKYNEYIKRLQSLNIPLTRVFYIYKFSINIFGASFTEIIFAVPKFVLIKARQANKRLI